MRSFCAAFGALIGLAAACGAAAAGAASPLDELRIAFTVGGKPVPPEIFADFGDADIADSDPIVTAVDVRAATGSNRYSDPIRIEKPWIIQTRANDKTMNGAEETAYAFIGKTANNLLVVVASWNGGGSGAFHTLHILDAAEAPAFDDEGKRTTRLTVSLVRNVVLGDRWDGSATIAGNAIRIVTTGGARSGADAPPKTVEARRP